MVAIATQIVACPACGAKVDIPISAKTGPAHHGGVEFTLTPDMTLREHLATCQ